MDLTASYTFNAPVETVWTLLTDPEVIAACLTGCDRLEPIGDDKYRASMKLAIAAISGNFDGTVAMLDKQPPHAYRLVVEGQGKPGFVKGEAAIHLSEDQQITTVSVQGHAHVGGLIARVGQRLLGSVSKTMTDRFFTQLKAHVEQHGG